MNCYFKKPDSFGKNWHPFVCFFKPFVCHITAFNKPNIWKKIPLVKISGFTLVELIITITVAGILMALAGPSLWQLFGQNRLTSHTNELIADINLSRSEAIKRVTTAGVCATAVNGTTCSGSNWANGWMVYFTDPNTNTVVLLRQHQQLVSDITLTSAANNIVYTRDGIASSGTGNYDLCDTKLGKFRRINVFSTGRPSLILTTPDTC